RDPSRLGAAERAALVEEIELKGALLVAEEKIGFGTTPSLTAAGLVPKPYAVRLFVTATAGGFAVMPGGLAMTVDQGSSVALSAPDGESRDVWVISEAGVPPHVSLWRPPIEAAQIQRTPHDLPSRAADNLFWLGRYTERADWTMRVLRICLGRLQEDSGPRQEMRASRVALEILLSKDEGEIPDPRTPTDAVLIEQLTRNLMTSTDWYYGLPRTIDNIHRVASLTRDRLSLEAWRTLNDFYASRRWQGDVMPTSVGECLDMLDEGLRVLASFHGLTHENMTRNYGWSFLDMGRRLSRAYNLSELLLGIFGKVRPEEDEAGSMLFVLELADSFITYRSRYRMAPILALLLDLLLIDESNPRSVAFQLAALSRHIDTLPQSGDGGARIEEQRTILSLLTQLRVVQASALAQTAADGTRPELERVLGQQVALLPPLSDAIGRRYFNLVEKGARWVRARSRTEQ
ncbi:MAG: circularly permuted type 2 ATP-grasp protein, partial [Hyphomicrobiaceae bacterium]